MEERLLPNDEEPAEFERLPDELDAVIVLIEDCELEVAGGATW